MTRLVIVGAGGHAAVVAESAQLQGTWDDICFIDDRYPDLSDIVGLPVVGDLAAVQSLRSDGAEFVIAIGNNTTRLNLYRSIAGEGGQMVSVFHPSASISRSANVEPGTVVMAQGVINARTKIGVACIVNTGATVDHDCVIDSGVHVSPGANLAGSVSVGERAWIGMGANVANNVSIGRDAIVGAGAAVLNDVAADRTAVGVPARELVRQ